ncbi:hypothetical protein [Erwinia sp. 198]|uniref:hypothetical protein n=1 Tax=Erwinia sp. 198 TaxID=2022746 RepID=UPI000F68C2D2|nr:hypothetical protein [Erwinia sp. 198]RRZ88098.1 hypothetical protein EGK14_18070 [Erwinia sp. 198]
MKYWLTAVTLLITSGAWAQDYRVVTAKSLQMDVWIDNVKDQKPASWCRREIPLRIVANGDKDPVKVNDLLPQVAGLMSHSCTKIAAFQWQLTDSNGKALAHGNATKAQGWQSKAEAETPAAAAAPAQAAVQNTPAAASVQNTPAAAPVETAPVNAEDLSPPADTTPWIQFSLLDGCHFRTYWNSSSHTSALFVPAKGGVVCGSDGWLSGDSQLAQLGKGAAQKRQVSFVQGFPVSGLNGKAIGRDTQITTVNNERMVLSDERSPQSWMIVPYAPALNGWQADGTVVVAISQQEASDENILKARLDEVRKVWSPYLADGAVVVKLVDDIHPQLKDPAAGAYRTLN